MLLMKRNGDALSIDDYDPLDLKHVLPWFIYSTSVTESLENTSAVSFWLYGFSVFSDAVYYSQVATSASGPVYYNNILYASGTVVYEKGTVELSQMKTPSSDNEKVHVYYVISFQLTSENDPHRSSKNCTFQLISDHCDQLIFIWKAETSLSRIGSTSPESDTTNQRVLVSLICIHQQYIMFRLIMIMIMIVERNITWKSECTQIIQSHLGWNMEPSESQ